MLRLLASVPAHARDALQRFFQLESSAGLLLIAAALLALMTANSSWSDLYQQALVHRLVFDPGVQALRFDKPVLVWINDALMAVFFLLVGLELKREKLEGQLAESGNLALPLLCALGGIGVPMLVYAALNHGDAIGMRGVAIPAATDIAFALAILTLLGSRVPIGLKLLLTAIAVLDDIGAIVIIAVFYTSELSVPALIIAASILLLLVILNRSGSTRLWPYLLLGVLMWGALAKSGLHATLAGVALGFVIPLRDPHDREHSPLLRLEHRLHPWVAFGILPLFAFANAGLPLAGFEWSALGAAVPLGVLLGLLLGKPLGIMLGFGIARFMGKAELPAGTAASSLLGMALLCGIGFTMSLFINHVAFAEAAPALAASAKLAVAIASLLSAVLGFALLRWSLDRSSP